MAGGRPWTEQEEWFVAQCVWKDMRIREIVDAIPEHFPARSYDSVHSAHSKRTGIIHEVHRLRSGGQPREDFTVPEPEAPEPLPELDPTDEKIMSLERQLLASRERVSHAEAKLKKAYQKETTGEFIQQVIREHVRPLSPARVKLPPRTRDSQTPADLVIMLGDEHADEVVHRSAAWGLEDYDFGIFRCRLQRLFTEAVEYATIHMPTIHFERAWIFKLGDAINGDIHGAGPRNHFGSTIPAFMATGDTEAQAIEFFHRETGLQTTVVGVSGNHPRTTVRKDYPDPRNNFDYAVMSQIATRLSGVEGVQVLAPRAWTAFVDVRGHPFALNHGDDLRGTWGIPWYGVDKRANRVQSLVARKSHRVRYFIYGHFHQDAKIPAAGGKSYFNGAFTLTSSYPIEKLSAATDPNQSLFVVTDRRGIAYQSDIELRDEEKEAAFRSGEWEPDFGYRTVLDEIEPDEGPVGELAVIQAEAA